MSTINYKFTLTGDTETGKECFFKKLRRFNEKSISTIGIDRTTINLNLEVCDKEGKIEKKEFCITFSNIGGQEKFLLIACSNIKESIGIFIVYNITIRETFERVESLIEHIKEIRGNNDKSRYVIVLIGNNLDLVEENSEKRDVDEDEAIQMCEEYDMIWGGEQSFTKLNYHGCIELLGKYTGEIYKKIGKKN